MWQPQTRPFGFWILDFGFWILDFGFWILDFGFWILDLGSWISDFGFWILDLGFWILDFGFWILDFGFCFYRTVWILHKIIATTCRLGSADTVPNLNIFTSLSASRRNVSETHMSLWAFWQYDSMQVLEHWNSLWNGGTLGTPMVL